MRAEGFKKRGNFVHVVIECSLMYDTNCDVAKNKKCIGSSIALSLCLVYAIRFLVNHFKAIQQGIQICFYIWTTSGFICPVVTFKGKCKSCLSRPDYKIKIENLADSKCDQIIKTSLNLNLSWNLKTTWL